LVGKNERPKKSKPMVLTNVQKQYLEMCLNDNSKSDRQKVKAMMTGIFTEEEISEFHMEVLDEPDDDDVSLVLILVLMVFLVYMYYSYMN
jgi:hypothetical protein